MSKSLIVKIRGLFSENGSRTRTSKEIKPSDRWLMVSVILLSIIGILSVYESSVVIAIRDFSNQFYYVKEQAQWFIVGLILMILLSFVNYHRYYALSLPFLLVSIASLLTVFIPGIGVIAYGAHRWVNIGFINFQPAELTKLSIVVYLAAWFSYPEKRRLTAFLLLLASVVGLVVVEPDLGTAVIILMTSLLMYFYSGAALVYFLFIVPILFTAVTGLVLMAPYRAKRLMSFLNPESDPLGSSYQIHQILLALGSGGWFGVGIGKSRQKYAYLPEANTDSIFAIIGEEIGFIGSLFVIGLFVFLIWRGFRIAHRTKDKFGRLLALGITSWISVQTVLNLASTVALVPLTGVPLPFVSYGGSSLVILLSAIGILLNISRQ